MRVGIDIGGTFTDLVVAHPDRIDVAKVPSTPDDPARAFETALGRAPGEPDEVRHGTTVATNAVLTRTGARLAVLTTEGFAHLLHIARQDRPSLYDLHPRRPEPLVPIDRCIGVRERIGPDGDVLRGVDLAALEDILHPLDVEGIAVTLLHSYANPSHERTVGDAIERVLGPQVGVSLSSDVLPELREYERASTTVMNAYVQPVMSRYLGRIRDTSGGARIGVMWSGGGVRGMEATIRHPIQTLFSGPAAGVLGAAWVAERVGVRDVITLDMGGTSADVAIVDDGEPLVAAESSLDGLPFRAPCLDVISVGAGGGSVGWVDEGGALRVGPGSAGADPGPACYGRGGTDATVTDAHVVLGHLSADGLAGGALPLDVQAARAAIERLGKDADLETVEAASGVLRVVRATMARALRSVSVERGRDIRRYALVAFGGAGPLHAVPLARELDVETVIVPPAPGTLAALGLLVASRRAEASVSRPMEAAGSNDGELRSVLAGLVDQVTAELADEGLGGGELRVTRYADCRYKGQSHELRMEVRDGFEPLVEAFHDAHRERYGFARPGVGVEAVTFRAVAAGPAGQVVASPPPEAGGSEPTGSRRIEGVGDVAVYERRTLAAGVVVQGPAIVTELDSTTWLPDGAGAEVHPSGALVVTP